MSHRQLEDHQDASSYLVDSKGDAYEPYSLAWRYLGMYIDCDLPEPDEQQDSSSTYENVNRRLASDDKEENDCSRKILWAAYHDPGYNGGSIGEYQFYDWQKGVWDKSTCQTKRCARMDCHESSTHFKLVGVFKETDGLTDWAEQLFKHQGYCLWDQIEDDDSDNDQEGEGGSGDDKDDDENEIYETMDGMRQYWPYECTEMYLEDYDGNTLYIEAQPHKEGNMTYGLYWDEDCTQEATMTYPEYVKNYFETYYGYGEEKGLKAAAYWSAKFVEWNHWMTSFKVCNPCRAYARVPNLSQDEKEDEKRFLNEDNNNNNNNNEDGEGDSEQWGYNCYDAAGYTNCNQCYKFETKTDLEPATVEDLQRASAQGTILAVKVDGKVYGQGYLSSTPSATQNVLIVFVVVGVLALLGAGLYMKRDWLLKLRSWLTQQLTWLIRVLSGRKKGIEALESSYGEAIYKREDDATIKSEEPEATVHMPEDYKEKEDEIETLKYQIEQERVQHQLERMRQDEYIKQLEKRIESEEALKEAAREANLSHSS